MRTLNAQEMDAAGGGMGILVPIIASRVMRYAARAAARSIRRSGGPVVALRRLQGFQRSCPVGG